MTTPIDPEGEDLRALLRQLRVEPPDAGFAAGLHRRLAEAGRPEAVSKRPARRWLAPLLWPAAGVAAGVAAYVALATLRPVREAAPPAPADEAFAVLPATKVALVRLNLSSDVAVASADLRVSLPEGLVFWVEGKALPERSFAWRQPLAAGANEIPIAVRGLRPGRYRVAVSARMGDEHLEHDVLLEVKGG